MKQLLKNGIVVSGVDQKKLDILMEDEKIIQVGIGLRCKDALVTDVSGKLIFPGFIDAHTHFDLEVCDTVTADNFDTGTKAAIIGGTTFIIDFATQNHGELLTQALTNWHRKADGNCSCDYGFHMAISDWNPTICKEIEDMIVAGIPSFKLYMTYDNMYLCDEQIYDALKRVKEVHGIVGVHCENRDIIRALTKEEKKKGHCSVASHPYTRPAEVEAEAIHRLLTIASLVDVPVVIVHLSSALGYEEIVHARKRGQKVYIETCPQYLLLEEDKYFLAESESRKYVIAPPLRKGSDREQLWKGLKTGEIDTISTDHCSFTTEQKNLGCMDFTKIPGGLPGVETRGSLIYTYGVLQHKISLSQMCSVLSENPAKIYGVYPQKGCIAQGSDADIVVWNPEDIGILT
ncbi:MAG: dihydropyrimidinase, partial [Hungatella sp.]